MRMKRVFRTKFEGKHVGGVLFVGSPGADLNFHFDEETFRLHAEERKTYPPYKRLTQFLMLSMGNGSLFGPEAEPAIVDEPDEAYAMRMLGRAGVPADLLLTLDLKEIVALLKPKLDEEWGQSP